MSDQDSISLILRRLQLTAEIFQHAKYCGQWAVDTSGQRMAPFHLIQKGQSWLHQPGKEPQCLNPGDLVVLPRDSSHVISFSPDTPNPKQVNQAKPVTSEQADNIMLCGFFEFSSRATWPLLDALPDAVVLSSKTHNFAGLVEGIFTELDHRQPGSMAMLETLAQGLFIFVLRAALQQGVSSGVLSALLDRRLGPALALIHGDPSESLNIQKLAAAASLSRTAFAERFKDQLGESPMRYLQRWRLQVAMDLLARTNDSVSEIAARVGYASEVSFRQSFRKEMGMTPSEARRG